MTKQTKLIIFFFCIVKLTLHLIADYHSGFQGDELIHIETGRHLAFGYMEFPPLIGLLAFIQNLFHSNSVFVNHLFAHIASILILIFTAKTILELGGKSNAIFWGLLCLLIASGFGRSQQLFQPVVFSQLFWVISFYQLIRFVKYLDKKYLWYLTIFLVLGFSVKYDTLFFLFGLLSLFFFKRTRNALLQQNFWQHIIVFTLLVLPNMIWQYANDFPVLQMFSRLYETQLGNITPFENLQELILSINPLSLFLLVPAFFFMFNASDKTIFRPLAFSIILSIFF